MIESPEENAEQLAEVHVVGCLIEAKASAKIDKFQEKLII